jgi:glycosyltransferase involved in cell wall biosynthesis
VRVAFTTLAPFISGAERSLQITLAHLKGVGVDPIVISPPQGKLAPWCRDNDIPYHACPLPLRDKWRAVQWWWSVAQLKRLLREQHVELVHANQIWCYPAISFAARDLGLPRICHMRDEVSPAALDWFCLSGAEAIICISRHIERQVSSGWSATRPRPWLQTIMNPVRLPLDWNADTVPVICDPVSLPKLPTNGAATTLLASARRKFDLPASTTILGFIGQVVPVKGVLPLLDSLKEIESNSRWHLLIAGKDPNPGAPHEQLCRQRVQELGLTQRVTFAGFLENVEPFYHAIDLAVVPSLEEPLGRIPLEAAAYGKPALASAVGGLPDTIVADQTGWLVPPPNEQSWSSHVLRALDAPLKEIGRKARTWAEQVADPVAYARTLGDVYRRVIQSRRAKVAEAASV